MTAIVVKTKFVADIACVDEGQQANEEAEEIDADIHVMTS